MRNFAIERPKKKISDEVQRKIDTKTKPLGALGELETIGHKICLIQQTTSPAFNKPHVIVFAGDHGLSSEGISAYPSEVTHQMVLNFLSGGAAINVFCKSQNIELSVVDAGVNYDFDSHPKLINRKIGHGTRNSLKEEAMSDEEFLKAISYGAEIVHELYHEGTNIIGFGEMGIGNTSAASLIMSHLSSLDIEDCVGRGTGLDDQQFAHKVSVLQSVYDKHASKDPIHFFRSVSGFEMVMMLGAMMQAAENKMTLMIDGFITSSVFMMARSLYPEIDHYALCTHLSEEQGHLKMLESFHQKPLLQLNLRLGEGTGCALSYPIIQSSIDFINEMASFESASVSQSE